MSDKKVIKPVALAVGAALAGSFALAGAAVNDTAENPFGMSELSAGYMLGYAGEGSCGGDKEGKQEAEGSCGEGSCGSDMEKDKDAEGSCGEAGDKEGEGSCGESGDKAGEGSCGESGEKETEGSCGEGSCGADTQ
jgi:uncharacterized low-complexity protein